MSGFSRQATLRAAEKALREGRLSVAIKEYARVIESDPDDWNTANALGDLYIRDGQIDRGLDEFIRIANHFAAEGFHAKASAFYKKVLKIRPDHEHALLQSGEMAARIGLLADARNAFAEVAARRSRRGDEQGAALMEGRIEALDADEQKVTRSV